MICLPYWGGTARTYNTLQSHLAENHPNLTTIAVSHPGTGRSSQAIPSFDSGDAAPRAPISNLASMVTFLLLRLLTSGSLINHEARVVLVGHSMGGKIVTAVLASEITLSIKAMVLLAPAPPGPMGLGSEERIARSHAYDNFEIAKYAIKEKLTLVHASDGVLSELAEDAVSMSPEAKAHWMQYGIDEDIAPRLAAASERSKTTKIRILAGTLDEVETIQQIKLVIIPAFTRCGLEDVQILEVQDCGHLLPVDDCGVIEVTGVLLEVMGSY